MVGWMPVVEEETGYLLGGRTVSDGAVFDKLLDALACMAVVIDLNVQANRDVKLGKVVWFEGMVSCAVTPDEEGEHAW